MNRRTLLAGATATLSGCGLRERLAARVHGCVDAPIPSAAGVSIERGVVPTRAVRTDVRYALAVPQHAARLDAVAYLLPGRGGTADDAMNAGFAGFLAEHVRRGGTPFALAAIDAGETYFHRRANGEDRLRAATVDLPRVVRAVLGVTALREALVGQSMGGYGALLAAERQPRRFRAVAVAGPALFSSYADEASSVGDAFDSAPDFARNDVIAHAAALRSTPVLIYAGARDPFVPGDRLFARAAPNARVVI